MNQKQRNSMVKFHFFNIIDFGCWKMMIHWYACGCVRRRSELNRIFLSKPSVKIYSRVPVRIYPRYTGDLSKIWHRFTQNKAIFGVSFWKLTQDLLKMYQRFTLNLPKIYSAYRTLTQSLLLFFPLYQWKHVLLHIYFLH